MLLRGFTLAELIAIIVIVAILAVTAMASVSGSFAKMRGFYDELLSQARYARKVAIAQRRPVYVRIDAAQSILCYEAVGACTGVQGPNGAVPFAVQVPAGVGVTAATIAFDSLGRYLDPMGNALTITVTGDGSLSFTVEHETGYVHS